MMRKKEQERSFSSQETHSQVKIERAGGGVVRSVPFVIG